MSMWDTLNHISCVPSGAFLFAKSYFIEKTKCIITPDATQEESGLNQMIMMGKYICHKWVEMVLKLRLSKRMLNFNSDQK